MKKQEREFWVFEKEKCLKLNILITPKQDLVYTDEHIGTFHWRSITRWLKPCSTKFYFPTCIYEEEKVQYQRLKNM